MHRFLWIALLTTSFVRSQNVENANELLQKVRSFAESTKSWRAEVVETSKLSGGGMNVRSEIHIKIAAEPTLKMKQQNSGSDQTIFVCDGVETFYSGDGHSYYKGKATVTPQCDLPLSKFYDLGDNSAAISVVGRDHVRLSDGERDCVVVRVAWNRETVNTVSTMCIDPARHVILRNVTQSEDRKTGIQVTKTTTFSDFESNPAFPPDTFRFSVPLGAVEAKPPI